MSLLHSLKRNSLILALPIFVANNESFTYLNAEHAGAFPAVTAQAYIRTALQTLMSSVAGGADVQESLDAAVTYIQEELANE